MSTSLSPAFGPGATSPYDPAREQAVARAAGYAAGWSQGAQAAQATVRAEAQAQREQLDAAAAAERRRLAQASQALQDAAAQLRAVVPPAVDDVTDAVLDTAVRLAAAVLGHEPLASTTPGRDALRRALAAGPEATSVTVRLSPEDARTLTDADTPDGVTVVADPALGRGDSVVTHGAGRVEVLLQAALRRAEAALAS